MRSPHFQNRGFTLIEVVMAVGIAAFAMVTIFGVLAVGLDTKQRSGDRHKAAELAWNAFEELKGNPDLEGNVATVIPTFPRYYGPDGELLGSGGGGYVPNSIYRLTLDIVGDDGGDPVLPNFLQGYGWIANIAVETPPADMPGAPPSRIFNFTQVIYLK